MKKIFLDTNVLLDYLAARQPFSLEAARLIELSSRKKIRLFISAVSFNNIYYILRRSISHKEAIHVLRELQEFAEVIDLTKSIIKKSLNTEFSDFEDALQYSCARSVSGMEIIVTRDAKGFKSSAIPVLTPKESLSAIDVN
ncbi:MAG: type II toxin-antitoxin system VapC family toxin [Bacteroidota bacterium]